IERCSFSILTSRLARQAAPGLAIPSSYPILRRLARGRAFGAALNFTSPTLLFILPVWYDEISMKETEDF
ncbi:MAG: hypothetical protein PUE19_00205, partial [bacterium]|nr:hypothetical protein [bacterium]